MTDQIIYRKKYDTNDIKMIHESEVWRYAGYKGTPGPEESRLLSMLEQVKEETEPILAYQVCYRRMDITWQGEKPILPFEQSSKDLAKCLQGCDQVVMFAATIGMGIDRLIRRNQHGEITKALLMQALGAERIEALCDTFCEEMAELLAKEGRYITPRYSPGYGDLPLEIQKDLVVILDCYRKAGISLSESLLMTPSKSVTAVFGVKKDDCFSTGKEEKKCDRCGKRDCQYRQ